MAVDVQKEVTLAADVEQKMAEERWLASAQRLKPAVGAEGLSIFVSVSTVPTPGPVAVPDREPIVNAADTISTIERGSHKLGRDPELSPHL
jgi:hypothetical protein